MTAFGPAPTEPPEARVPDVRVHEELGNALHRLARTLDGILAAGGEPGREALRALRRVGTDTLHTLNAAAADAGGRRWGGPLDEALQGMAAEFSEVAGVLAHVDVHGRVEHVPHDVAEVLRHVAVEALWNVDRHARASILLLSLEADDAQVTLDIVDDGVDISLRQVSAWGSCVDLGLRRMRQGVARRGGRLTVHGLRPRGLRIHAAVPVDRRQR